MNNSELRSLLHELIMLPHETEWVEFKHNLAVHQDIGEYISALSNSACLHDKDFAYLVWGIDSQTHKIIGTTFSPRSEKHGNQELESWLALQLQPRIDFTMYEFDADGCPVVMFIINPARQTPVAFRGEEFIRIGSYKKKLKEFPEKERKLWSKFSKLAFEKDFAARNLNADEVLSLIDYPAYFELMGQTLPDNRAAILERLRSEKIITPSRKNSYDITNLGAILFAKKLSSFEYLARKALRVIIYRGTNRIETIKEQVGGKGYAVGFEGLITYINDQLPRNEELGQAFRKEILMFPEVAIRELVANALIHQDLHIAGSSPMVEIFTDRIEITNPGTPLIDTLRFIDEPPQSRNETLAGFMRRLNICEERGSGIDKVIFAIEFYQLPAPEFIVTDNHTKAILFAPKKLTEMDKKDKIRACYQHACLCYVSNMHMTNATLRKRFSIEEANSAIASRIISDTLEEKLIKPYDPENKSRKHAKYIPFWA
jgi:ATP-dependent DNA helicase RecG